MPDYALLHQVIGRSLEDQAAQMAELHQRHHHWRARERHDKAKLRAAAVALRDSLRDVRHLFDRVFGTRQGVANSRAARTCMRLPMHSLENGWPRSSCRMLDDDAFGWSASAFDLQAHYVRETLGAPARGLSRRERGLDRKPRAAGAPRRPSGSAGWRNAKTRPPALTQLLRGLCRGAGFENAARSLRPRLPAATPQAPRARPAHREASRHLPPRLKPDRKTSARNFLRDTRSRRFRRAADNACTRAGNARAPR